MRVDRLGKLFEQKYNLRALAAGEPEELPPFEPYKPRGLHEYRKPGVQPQVTFPLPKMDDVEAKVRNSLDTIWKIPSDQYNILRACADADLKNPNPAKKEEVNAQRGFWFCRNVLSIIDWLKANRDRATLSEIKEALTDLITLIKKNMGAGGPEAQFMHVSDLVMFLLRHLKTNVRAKEIPVQRNKVKHGLAHIMSKALDTINYMNELGGARPMTGRFTPNPTELFPAQIDDFIREFGDQFGLPNKQAWEIVTNVDPSLVPKLRKLVHTLKRPYRAQAFAMAPRIRATMQGIIRKYLLARATNQPYFETADPSLFEFEENKSGESPSVLSPQQLQQAIQKRDLEQQQQETAHKERLNELLENEKQIEEDRERHVRKDGTSFLLDQLLKGIQL